MIHYLPYLIVSIVCGVIGMAIGDLGAKKNGLTGLALGALLGPLGILITALLPPECQKRMDGQKTNVVPLLIVAAVMGIGIVVFVSTL